MESNDIIEDIALQQNGQGSPVLSSPSTGSNGVKPVSTKRKVVSRACNNCKRLHAKCSNERPCTRCGASGMACIDSPRKKRQPRTNPFLNIQLQQLYNQNMSSNMFVKTVLNTDSTNPSNSKEVFEKSLGLDRPLPVIQSNLITNSQFNNSIQYWKDPTDGNEGAPWYTTYLC